MNLAEFIRADMTLILADWTAFAKKAAPSNGGMTDLALTDHAQGILLDIATDIETYQSKRQQFEKSQGEEPDFSVSESAAAIHGRLRQASNFSLSELSSEFRALRATVLRRWLPRVEQMSETTTQEMVRFNEAIDQAMAESITTYSARADRTRDLFLAVLGHDLRAPLATVSLAADLLMRTELPHNKVTELAQKAHRSTKLMAAMITDLLGFTRLQMGAGMPTTRAPIDAKQVCIAAVADAQAMYPGSRIEFSADGNLTGNFDAVRLQQLITNLLINAAQHSDSERAVTLTVSGLADAIEIKVHNIGPVIPEESLSSIFQPLVQLDPDAGEDAKPRTSLGLGLFIAHQTAIEHGGTISVTSNEDGGTVFTVNFPRDR